MPALGGPVLRRSVGGGPVPAELEEQAEAVRDAAELGDAAVGQREEEDGLDREAPAGRARHAWMGPGVGAALGDPGRNAVVLRHQLLDLRVVGVERVQLAADGVEGGPRLVRLPVDDLVVIHDVRGHEARQRVQPALVDGREEPGDGRLVAVERLPVHPTYATPFRASAAISSTLLARPLTFERTSQRVSKRIWSRSRWALVFFLTLPAASTVVSES